MQDLEKFKNEMSLSGKNVYVGNRYAPVLDDTGWDNTKKYEPLTIIQYQGDSYVSRTWVPEGVDITNKDYWYSIGVYNAQVASYKKRVEDVENQYNTINTKVETNTTSITDINEDITELNNHFNEVVAAKENYTDLKTKLANIGVYKNVKDYGAVGDGVADDTDAINQAIENHTNVYIPDGEYLIDAEKYIRLKSNRSILMSENTVLKVKPNNNNYYAVFYLNTVSNVEIIGGTLIGDRDNHLSTTGEWGHGIEIRGCTNITIKDLTAKDFWGDGLYIGVSGGQKYSKNITLENVVSDNNRRQGLSVISVDGLYGLNVTLSNTNGTAPQAGVDFEPNNPDEILQNIVFKNLRTYNNAGSGVLKHLSQLDGTNNLITMTFENYLSEFDGIGINHDMLKAEGNGYIKYINPVIKNSQRRSIGVRSFNSKGVYLEFLNPIILNPNRSLLNSTTESAAISFFRLSTDFPEASDLKMGNVKILNPTIKFDSGLTSPVTAYISFSTQLGDNNTFFEKVDIQFKEPVTTAFQILNALRLNKSKISHMVPNEYLSSQWFGDIGESQITEYILPTSTRYQNLITFPTDRNGSVRLNANVTNNMPFEVKIQSDGNNGWESYVRPPENERLYPLKYSSANGKGIKIPKTADGTGNSVTVKRVNGKWTVQEIVGEWEVE